MQNFPIPTFKINSDVFLDKKPSYFYIFYQNSILSYNSFIISAFPADLELDLKRQRVNKQQGHLTLAIQTVGFTLRPLILPGVLLEMQFLKLHPRPTKSENVF